MKSKSVQKTIDGLLEPHRTMANKMVTYIHRWRGFLQKRCIAFKVDHDAEYQPRVVLASKHMHVELTEKRTSSTMAYQPDTYRSMQGFEVAEDADKKDNHIFLGMLVVNARLSRPRIILGRNTYGGEIYGEDIHVDNSFQSVMDLLGREQSPAKKAAGGRGIKGSNTFDPAMRVSVWMGPTGVTQFHAHKQWNFNEVYGNHHVWEDVEHIRMDMAVKMFDKSPDIHKKHPLKPANLARHRQELLEVGPLELVTWEEGPRQVGAIWHWQRDDGSMNKALVRAQRDRMKGL